MRKYIYLLLLLVFATSMKAQQLTEAQAKQRALEFLNKGDRAKGTKITTARLKSVEMPLSHLFSYNVDGGGFVVVSGDSRTLPILGYSDHGTIDYDNMPDNMRGWLKGYEQAIAALGDAAIVPQERTSTERPVVEPLLKTQWNQDWPYDARTPVFENVTVPEWEGLPGVTGCVATAMAMVMKYHEWPQASTTSVPSYTFSYSKYGYEGEISVDELPPFVFDWKNMLDEYYPDSYSEEQLQAVAYLMRYCGQSIRMMYTPEISSAFANDVAFALRKYFGYDNGTHCVKRSFYGIDEWEDMIYAELAEGRPVIYAGYSDAGGHCFTCDGYAGEGMFHINWGWGGVCDGNFILSILNPYNIESIGAANSYLGFCMNQQAVLGIQPRPESETPDASIVPQMTLWSDIEYDNAEEKFYFYLFYESLIYDKLTWEIAFCSKAEDGTLSEVFSDEVEFIAYGGKYLSCPLNLLDVPVGTTNLYLAVRCKEVGIDQWQLVYDDSHYVELTNSAEGIQVAIKPDLDFSIIDAKFSHPGTVYEDNFIDLKIKNNGPEANCKLNIMLVNLGDDTIDKIADHNNANDVQWKQAAIYMREGETIDFSFPFEPTRMGNVAVLLQRGYEDPVDATTVTVENDINWFDFEVVDCTVDFPEEDNFINATFSIKNNDSRDWFANANEKLGRLYYLQCGIEQPGLAQKQPLNESIMSGETYDVDTKKEYIDFITESSCKEVVFYIEQKIGNYGKRIFEVPVKRGEATGVEGIKDALKKAEGEWYDLKGVRIGKPSRRGVFVNGKRTVMTAD